MKLPNRREICGLTAGFAVACLELGVAKAENKSKDNDTSENDSLLLVGPFSLADLYKNQEDLKNRDMIGQGGGPSTDKIASSFEKTTLYILDKLTRKEKSDSWVLAQDPAYPKLFLQGKSSFTFVLDDKSKFDIHINETKFLDLETEILLQPMRKAHILVDFSSSLYRFKPDIWATGFSCQSHMLQYSSNGKFRFPTLDKKNFKLDKKKKS